MSRGAMTKLALVSIGIATTAWASSAAAEDYKARAWASTCFACHGTDGRSEGEFPALAGKSEKDLYEAMLGFKAETRKPSTIMHQHAKGYTDDQLKRIAAFFSTRTKK